MKSGQERRVKILGEQWQGITVDRNYVLHFFKYLSPHARFNEGLPIDRYYIDSFIESRRQDIKGHVLEIGDDAYTRRFGGAHISKSDVLSVTEDNEKATIVADLTCADNIPSGIFDCIILTQTLHYIYDVRAAVKTLCRVLKPRGVLLASLPGIAHISRYDMEHWGEYWRFTTMSARRLFEGFFPAGNIEVQQYGNMLTAIAFLLGLDSEELSGEELQNSNPDFQVLLTVRAVKPVA